MHCRINGPVIIIPKTDMLSRTSKRAATWAKTSSILTAAVVSLLGLHGQAVSQQRILLSPQIIELELRPGAKSDFELMVANADPNSPMVVSIGVSPMWQNERGDYKIAEEENQWSCASWIQTEDKQIELPAGGYKRLTFDIKVPFAAVGSKYAAITVSFGGQRLAPGASGMSFRFRVAAYVELNIARGIQAPKVEISDLDIVPLLGDKAAEDKYGKDAFYIAAEVSNVGDVGIIGKANLRIREERGLVRREVPLGGGRGMVIPGAAVKYRSVFRSKPPPGIYIAEASLNYGGIKPAASKVEFSVTEKGEIKIGRVQIVEAVGMSITPRWYEMQGAPGSRKTIGISVHNVEDVPLKVSTVKLPLTQSEDGRYIVPKNPGPQSCHEWIELEPDELEIPPRTRKRIKVTIKVPRDAAGSAYSRIAFMPEDAALSEEAKQESYSTNIFMRIPPNIERDIDIRSFKAAPEGRFLPVDFVFGVKNTGNCHVDIDATISVDDAQGLPVKELRLLERNTRILPGITRTFSVVDDLGLESGDYTADLVVSVGNESQKRTDVSFKIYK